MTVRDEKASISGVMWGYDPTEQAWVKEGLVVAVDGEVSSYQGALQLKVEAIQPSTRSAGAFVKTTKFDIDFLWESLLETVDSFEEPLTKYVAEEILLRIADDLKKAPAAKGVHNAWYGGLLEHIWSLCQMAEPIIKHYQRKEYHPTLSRDKVLFGLMLHDAGKVVEYDFSTPVFQYAALGTLASHMVIGPAWVYEQANIWWGKHHLLYSPPMSCEQFKYERAHLLHVLAAHHGRFEWGSPVKPATVEAVLVHHLDNLDSKVLHALDYVNGKPGPVPYLSEKSYIEGVSYLQFPKWENL